VTHPTGEDENKEEEQYIDLEEFTMDLGQAAEIDEIPIWHDSKNKYE